MSGTFTTWIWPIRIGSVASARKPPFARINLHAEPSAATTDGSSTTIGTTYCLSLTSEVHAETERQAHHADHVLDHLVRGVELERVLARRERAEIGVVDQAALVHGANALLDAELVEIGNPQSVAHSHRSPTLASANSFTVRPRSAKPSSITRNPSLAYRRFERVERARIERAR